MSSRKGVREHDLDSAGASPGWVACHPGDLPEGYHAARVGGASVRAPIPIPARQALAAGRLTGPAADGPMTSCGSE
jgi:hypothetical protein